jgi:DNA-binding CsgD family transcriptional regulator
MSQWAIVFETFLEKVFPFQGFMLLDHQGTLVQSSPYAQELCRAMDCEVLPQRLKPLNPKEWLPIKISSLIRCLRESRQRLPEHRIQLQEVVVLRDHTRLRLAANWIELEPQQPACIVVTLENLTAIAHQQALTDARRHQLTERESQVWECALLGLSYSEIGQELFISINTVKRHMKSIHRKQEG